MSLPAPSSRNRWWSSVILHALLHACSGKGTYGQVSTAAYCALELVSHPCGGPNRRTPSPKLHDLPRELLLRELVTRQQGQHATSDEKKAEAYGAEAGGIGADVTTRTARGVVVVEVVARVRAQLTLRREGRARYAGRTMWHQASCTGVQCGHRASCAGSTPVSTYTWAAVASHAVSVAVAAGVHSTGAWAPRALPLALAHVRGARRVAPEALVEHNGRAGCIPRAIDALKGSARRTIGRRRCHTPNKPHVADLAFGGTNSGAAADGALSALGGALHGLICPRGASQALCLGPLWLRKPLQTRLALVLGRVRAWPTPRMCRRACWAARSHGAWAALVA